MDRLSGKTCFVTGSGQGIGRSVVERFLEENATVVAADLCLKHAPTHPRLSALELDVTNEAQVSAAAANHPNVSVLVNCVGVVADGAILDCSLEEFDRSLWTNVRSMVLTIRNFLPAMLKRREGVIINIASVVSSVMAAPNRFAYGTSKAAVIGLTMSVARDYIQKGIRCNAISPGTIETPSLQVRMAASGNFEEARRIFLQRQPMGRLGAPAEIAAIAVLLASDESRFMTGSNIIIDGGMSL